VASLFCTRDWKKLAIVSAVQSVAPEKLAFGKNPRFSTFRFYCFTSFVNEVLWTQWLKTLPHTFFQTPFETTMCVCVLPRNPVSVGEQNGRFCFCTIQSVQSAKEKRYECQDARNGRPGPPALAPFNPFLPRKKYGLISHSKRRNVTAAERG